MPDDPRLMNDPFRRRSAPLDWPVRSGREQSDWGIDPSSGAVIRKLTSSPFQHDVIYTEQPYTSPDGRRVAIVRTADLLSDEWQLLVADVVSGEMWLVEPSISRAGLANAAFSGWIHYSTHERGVRRVSLTTLEKRPVLPDGELPVGQELCSVSPDQATLLLYDTRDAEAPSLLTLTLGTGEEDVIYRDPDNWNTHGQFDQIDGSRVLYQKCSRRPGDRLQVLIYDRRTRQHALLPIGGEHTAESSGHMAWIGGTSRIACLVEWHRAERRHDSRHSAGNLVIASAEDDTPQIIGGSDRAYWQIAVSRCGRYFVCNEWMACEANYRAGADILRTHDRPGWRGPIPLIVGSFATGRTRTLISEVPSAGWGHYLTADNRHVVYAAEVCGLRHAFVATLPDGLLESLDQPA